MSSLTVSQQIQCLQGGGCKESCSILERKKSFPPIFCLRYSELTLLQTQLTQTHTHTLVSQVGCVSIYGFHLLTSKGKQELQWSQRGFSSECHSGEVWSRPSTPILVCFFSTLHNPKWCGGEDVLPSILKNLLATSSFVLDLTKQVCSYPRRGRLEAINSSL